MGNSIEARQLIGTLLNANISDPYPGTRKGSRAEPWLEGGQGSSRLLVSYRIQWRTI